MNIVPVPYSENKTYSSLDPELADHLTLFVVSRLSLDRCEDRNVNMDHATFTSSFITATYPLNYRIIFANEKLSFIHLNLHKDIFPLYVHLQMLTPSLFA
jgi:hypothetical protein